MTFSSTTTANSRSWRSTSAARTATSSTPTKIPMRAFSVGGGTTLASYDAYGYLLWRRKALWNDRRSGSEYRLLRDHRRDRAQHVPSDCHHGRMMRAVVASR